MESQYIIMSKIGTEKSAGSDEPKVGDRIYVPTSLYVYRGEDDFMGGIATISGIDRSNHLPPEHYNYMMVSIKERPGSSYNWRYLMENQDKWREQYGDQVAKPDPDTDPEFNQPNADWK